MLRALHTSNPQTSGTPSRPRRDDWRSLRLVGPSSVEALNRLLRGGWCVIAVNVDGVSLLPRTAGADAIGAPTSATSVDIVLARDESAPRQSAVWVGRDAQGSPSLGSMPVRMHGWIRTLVLAAPSGDAVVLYEREESHRS